MGKNLLIVESPAKAKTIERFLGEDFVVKSSYGHIRDLAKGNAGVDIENDFKPKYVVAPEKRKVVKALKDAAKTATNVWLATDEDREGEAISWHLCEELGLDAKLTKRIVFREITKTAIQEAIKHPRFVDLNLVNAQQARRILDRLVGFELSELLWRKIKPKLSAGRVQSVAVKLIVDREREIQSFLVGEFYKISALFKVKNEQGKLVDLKAELKSKVKDKQPAQIFLKKCRDASFKIADIQVKPSYRRPAPPFTTSTLQQEASRKMGFGVKRTMSTAQKLYEQGHITYMRTDSTNLSQLAINTIAQQIKTDFGEEYLKIRKYKSKVSNAQEAHEAIRPSYIDRKHIKGDRDMQRLYDLIWRRAMASQMANAELEKTIVNISVSSIPNSRLEAVGEVMKFDGFLKLYMVSKDEDDDEETKGILPPLHVGQMLNLDEMVATQVFTKPPPRFTEASLVKKLEENGIGRPSTYAPTISKIMEDDRGYVTKESRPGVERKFHVLKLKDHEIIESVESQITGATTNRLYPSDMGMLVTDFLSEHFEDIMDYNFTADIEKEFDIIATGKRDWNEMIERFYSPFHETVENTKENADRARGRRELGIDPETGHTVLVQMTKYGPVVQIGTREEVGEAKPKFANLQNGQSLETIDFDTAMGLFNLPRTLGEWKENEVKVLSGRFGPYLKYGTSNLSLPKMVDPFKLTFEEACKLIKEKEKENAPIGMIEDLPVTKGKGRFGPYLKWNGLFINVPKKYDFENISMEEASVLIEQKKEKEAKRYIQRWEDLGIAIENGRWGPFIRFKRKAIKLPKKDGAKFTEDELKSMSLEEVQKIIETEIPSAFKKRKKKPS